MDGISFLNLIGTIASIGGAWLSLYQASKSRSAADEAIKVRDRLVGNREASEIAQLQGVCKKALKSMEKYGPGSVPSSLIGVVPDNDSNDLQEFILSLSEHRNLFGISESNEAVQFCDIVTPLLNAFAKSTTLEKRRKLGTQLVMHLSNMSSIIKKLLDTKKDSYQ